jgi:hypothetical protein
MLTPGSRGGFTLVELMLSLVMMLAVSGTLYRLVFSSQRLSRAQAERIAVQSSLRGAALVVGNELRELNAVPGGTGTETDLLSLGATAVAYRGMRGFGYTCQALGAGLLRLSRSSFTGYRDPQPGRDSVLLYAPGLRAPADSSWIPMAITKVSTSEPCSGAAAPAITLTTVASPSLGPVPAGAPVRVYELMELASYRSDRQWWLGMRSLTTAEAIQPLFGPLAEDGFRLDYADGSGLPTAVRGAVRSIQLALKVIGSVPEAGTGVPVVEQLSTRILLRNGVH